MFPALDRDTLRLVAYTDSSFANRTDISSQIGYLICLADASNKMRVLGSRSCKTSRVARSAMVAETLAFTAALNAAIVIRHQLQLLLRASVLLLMLTDSKSLFDVLISNQSTTERRLMVNIFSLWQSYHPREIDISVCLHLRRIWLTIFRNIMAMKSAAAGTAS